MVTTRNQAKKRRLAISSTVGIDRLTELDENLVSTILSRLPTKDAVRTSILSKKWRHKWVLMDKDDIGIQSSPISDCVTFTNFLDEIITSRKHLRFFRAKFPKALSDNIQKWISAVLRHGLEYLDVHLDCTSIILHFSRSLLNHTSLREVRVVGSLLSARVSVDKKNCAPELAKLCLYNIVFVPRSLDFSTISLDFPVLETLEYKVSLFGHNNWCQNLPVRYVEINAPSLTSFSFTPKWFYGIGRCDHSLKIVAPRLTRFSCFGDTPENLILDGSLVVYAFLVTKSEPGRPQFHGRHAANLVNGFTNLEELTLSSCMAKVLTTGPPLHCHDKLTRVTLHRGSEATNLFKLLLAMPSLKSLSVNVGIWEDYDYEAMEITPSCIASCLEEVVLQVFSGNVPQQKLAEFMLKTAKKLQKLTITTDYVGRSKKMKKVLSALGGCSPSLEICSRLPDIEHTDMLENAQH